MQTTEAHLMYILRVFGGLFLDHGHIQISHISGEWDIRESLLQKGQVCFGNMPTAIKPDELGYPRNHLEAVGQHPDTKHLRCLKNFLHQGVRHYSWAMDTWSSIISMLMSHNPKTKKGFKSVVLRIQSRDPKMEPSVRSSKTIDQLPLTDLNFVWSWVEWTSVATATSTHAKWWPLLITTTTHPRHGCIQSCLVITKCVSQIGCQSIVARVIRIHLKPTISSTC